jgi:DNA repair photolyase
MTKGTKEWAKSNINIQKGCSHGCLYCYASFMKHRFRSEGKTFEDEYAAWTNKIQVSEENVKKKYGTRKGVIMFPTSHDITEDNIENYLIVLHKLIQSKNQVLITTKAHLPIIQRICKESSHRKRSNYLSVYHNVNEQ